MVSHERWLAGHAGGVATEKGTEDGEDGTDPWEPEPEPPPEEPWPDDDEEPWPDADEEPPLASPAPVFELVMKTAGS